MGLGVGVMVGSTDGVDVGMTVGDVGNSDGISN